MRSILPCLLLAALSPTAGAVDEFRFDPVHSQVQFHVEHLGFSFSEGEFQQFEGWFRFDPKDPDSAACDVRLPIAGLDMDDAGWTKKMLGKDWFDAETHPDMHFRCTGLELDAEGRAGTLSGTLTLRGVSRPVDLALTVNRIATHKFSQAYVAGFSATTSIRRSEFGMTHLIPDIGDTVAIRLEIEGIRKPAKGGRPK